MDGDAQSFADGLTNCITRDGQGTPTAAINWGNQNLTTVGSFSAVTGAFSGNVSIAGNLTGVAALTTSGTIQAGNTTGDGYITISGGASPTAGSGQIQFFNAAGMRVGYIYQPSTGTGANTLVFGKDDSNGYSFPNGPISFGGAATFAGAVTVGGNVVGSGAIYPSSGNTNVFFTTSGASGSGTTTLGFDATDFWQYNEATNKLVLFIGGVAKFSIDASGNVIAAGNVTANGTP